MKLAFLKLPCMRELTTTEENMVRRFNLDVWDFHNEEPEIAEYIAEKMMKESNNGMANFLANQWCCLWMKKITPNRFNLPSMFTLDYLKKEMVQALNMYCFENPF